METATLPQSFILSMFILIIQGTAVDYAVAETKPQEIEISPKGSSGKVQSNNEKKKKKTIPVYVSCQCCFEKESQNEWFPTYW